MPSMERVLEITTNVGCNINCIYCPQSKIVRAYKKRDDSSPHPRFMSVSDFSHYLRSVPKNVSIHFSGFSEPWHNPDCTELVIAAHEMGYRIAVFTTGDRLSSEDARLLSKIPFKRFMVHLPDQAGLMRLKASPQYIATMRRLKDLNTPNLQFMTIGELNPQIVEALAGC